MKRVLIFGLIISLQILAFAQAPSFKINWSQPAAINKNKIFNIALFANDSCTIVLRSEGEQGPDCYNSNLTLVNNSLEHYTSSIGHNIGFLDVLGGTIKYGWTDYSKENSKASFKISKLQPNTFKLDHTIELGSEVFEKFYMLRNATHISAVSPDKTKIAFLISGIDGNILLLKVFDHNFNEIYSKSVSERLNCYRQTLVVDNKGNAAVQCHVFTSKVENEKIAVVGFPVGGGVNYHELNMGENVAKRGSVKVLKDGQVVIAGFYSGADIFKGAKANMMLRNSAMGVYVLRYDVEKNEFGKIYFNPFSESYRSQFQANGKDELKWIHLKDIEVTAEGDVLILAEQIIDYQTTGQSPETNDGEERGIMLIKIATNGKLLFESMIPKRQFTPIAVAGDGFNRGQALQKFINGYGSFVYAIGGNKLRILYNDNAKNIDVTDLNLLLKGRGLNELSAIVAEVDLITGKFSRKELFACKDTRVFMYPIFSQATSVDRFVIFAGNNLGLDLSSYKLGEVTFK